MMVINRLGNVGFGIANPQSNLHVHSNTGNTIQTISSTTNTDAYTRYTRTGSNGWAIGRSDKNASFRINYSGNSDQPTIGNTTDYFTIANDGKVGIGTVTPAVSLHVSGELLVTKNAALLTGTTYTPIIRSSVDGPTHDEWTPEFGWWGDWGTGIYHPSLNNFGISTGSLERFRINQNGNVGIGTKNPDQKLTVKGIIHAEELLIDLLVPADYVFEKYYQGFSTLKKDYTMPTLYEVEDFTKKYNHLPNVPSAKEIQTNGLHVGEMSNILLQKVEELTLYMIEMQKQNDLMKAENEKIKQQLEVLLKEKN